MPPKKPSTEVEPKPRRKRQGKYDWNRVRTEFVEGFQDPQNKDERVFVNLREIAERNSVPYIRVRERAAMEQWYDQRQNYQLRLAKSRQVKRIAELSRESVDFDSKSLQAAKLGMAMITTRISEIAREVQEQQRRREHALQMEEEGYAIDPKDLRSVIDSRELDTLSRAAIQWQQLGQKALGTDVQKIDVQHDITATVDVGMDVEVGVTSISAELSRDDPERLAAFLQAAKRAGLLDTVLTTPSDSEDQLAIENDEPHEDEEEEIVDAEIIIDGD